MVFHAGVAQMVEQRFRKARVMPAILSTAWSLLPPPQSVRTFRFFAPVGHLGSVLTRC